jgi:hypothetical protein
MDEQQWNISFTAGPIEIVPENRSGLQGVVIAGTANVAYRVHVFQAAVPVVRKSPRHARGWKNIPVDWASSVSTGVGTADDAFLVTFAGKKRVALPIP